MTDPRHDPEHAAKFPLNPGSAEQVGEHRDAFVGRPHLQLQLPSLEVESEVEEGAAALFGGGERRRR
ncbi:hypothetical protein ACFT9I_26755 [Streptomyces sp. NPDC057137]|uniref:hypothetical protein n=1 Tax=Streptomyces sp. NPDC057137 TaxID=3346030 RepID=UPI0036459E3F